MNTVDYETEFGCQDELKTFADFLRSEGAILNKTVTISKKSMKSSWIPLTFFDSGERKKIIKLVRIILSIINSFDNLMHL